MEVEDKEKEEGEGEKPLISLFASFQDYISNDQEIREGIKTVTRDLEKSAREVLAVLQAVHQSPSPEAVKKTCAKSRQMLTVVKSQYANLVEKIPAGQYYRFCDHWRFVSQRFAFLGAFIVYLESDRLITRPELAEMLGVHVERSSDGFHIDLDDFLTGLLLLANELPCSILKFPFRYKDALRQITSEHEKYIAVNSLQLAEKERLSLVKSLWDEGLLDME